MQTIILILPALAAFCFGAAIPKPQDLGGATTVAPRPEATYTLVVPCFGVTTCVPKTITIAARDDPDFTIPSLDLQVASRDPVPTLDPRDPQVIVVTNTRSVIVAPTGPSSTSTVKSTSSTKKTTSTSSTKKTTSTSKTSSSSTKKTTTSSTKKTTTTSSTKKSTSTGIKNSTSGQGSRTATIGNRQELGTPTRVVLEWPHPTRTPPASIVTVTVTYTPPVTTEPIPTTRVTSEEDGSTRDASTTLVVPIDKRQSLGSPSRTVLESPTWAHPPPPPPSTVTVTVTYTPPVTTIPTTRVTSEGDGSTRDASTTLVVPIDKRQSLGSPSRTVLESPTWVYQPPPPPPSTVTVTVTYTPPVTVTPPPFTSSSPTPTTTGRVTVTDDGSSRTVTSPLVLTIDKRQTLGEPTSTAPVAPVTVTVPTTLISSIYVTTTKIVTQTVPTTTKVVTETVPTTLKTVSTTTARISVTSTLTKSVTKSVTTCTETPVVTDDDGSSRTVSTTLTVPINRRQELGGSIPTFSVSWNGDGTAVPSATQYFDKRQVLGQPTRSFTFDGTVPTSSSTTSRSVTYYQEM